MKKSNKAPSTYSRSVASKKEDKKVRDSVRSSQYREKLIESINKMDDNQIEKVGQQLGVREDALSQQALDKLDDHESEYRNEEDDQVTELESVQTKSIVTRRTETGTYISSRTYVSKLEKELNEEKRARERIESELVELKKVSKELSEKLNSTK